MPSEESTARQEPDLQSDPLPGISSLARARVIEKLAWRIRVAELVSHEDAEPLWLELKEALSAGG